MSWKQSFESRDKCCERERILCSDATLPLLLLVSHLFMSHFGFCVSSFSILKQQTQADKRKESLSCFKIFKRRLWEKLTIVIWSLGGKEQVVLGWLDGYCSCFSHLGRQPLLFCLLLTPTWWHQVWYHQLLIYGQSHTLICPLANYIAFTSIFHF